MISLNNKNTRLLIALLLIAIVAITLRSIDIHNRPMHGDEAINAFKFAQLYEQGSYQYDPHEYHGPSLYYLTYPVMLANGSPSYHDTTVGMYRLVPSLFAIGTILLLYFLRNALGTIPTLITATIIALSPNMIFYSRYYIHEWLLVFFTMLMLVGIWRYINKNNWQNATLIGLAMGMMHTTKETCIIAWFAMTLGCIYWYLTTKNQQPNTPHTPRFTCTPTHLIIIFISALAISALFFSSFFSYPQGIAESFLTYKQYFNRAAGQGSFGLHDQPWYYYLRMLLFSKSGPGPWFSEAPIVILAIIGSITPFLKNIPLSGSRIYIQFLAIFTLIMTIIYSLISYKTPWCMLGFVHGMTLLAGVGTYTLWQLTKKTALATTLRSLLIASFIFLSWQSYRTNFRFVVDRRNPYLYANPQRSMLEIPQRAKAIAALHPDKMNMNITLIGADNWPLPFYLRQFTSRINFLTEPDEYFILSPVIIAEPQFIETLQKQLGDNYNLELKALRPQERRAIFIRSDLWIRFLHQQSQLQSNAVK